jgi:hypothetical protein
MFLWAIAVCHDQLKPGLVSWVNFDDDAWAHRARLARPSRRWNL